MRNGWALSCREWRRGTVSSEYCRYGIVKSESPLIERKDDGLKNLQQIFFRPWISAAEFIFIYVERELSIRCVINIIQYSVFSLDLILQNGQIVINLVHTLSM